ncbi:hypothetical protein GCM10010172_04730 [Paractinoplanes ferrugineus]
MVAAAWNPIAPGVLATLSLDGRIAVWQLRSGAQPEALLAVRSPTPGPASLAWLPGGGYLACAAADGVVSVWSLDNGVRHAQVLGRPSTCVALHAAHDDVLHAAYEDGSVRRTSRLLQPGRPTAQQFAPITAAAWSPTGQKLAVAHHGGFFEVHDDDLYVRWTGQVVTTAPLVLAWHHDKTLIVADRSSRTLTAFDTGGGELWKLQLTPEPAAMSVADDMLAVGCYNYAPIFVDPATGALLSSS